jgi:hypothetical protein
MAPKLYAPNVHLFAFHLHQISDTDEANKHWLWLNCDNIISKTLHQNLNILNWLDLDKEADNRFVELVKDEKNTPVVPIEGKVDCIEIKGFAYPQRLDDSYGLWLNLRRPEEEENTQGQTQKTDDIDISFLRKLNPDNCMMLGENKNYLGQTLIITAFLPANYHHHHQTSLKNIADECLQAFFPNDYKIPPFYRESSLFGNPIFEYGLFSQISNYCHVLVCFFISPDADKKIEEYQGQLFDLFLFRNKAIKAFQNSRKFYQDTNNYHQIIKTEIDSLDQYSENEILTQEQLDEFKKKLKQLPKIALDYAELLRELEACQNTISIHASNYNDRLQQIRDINPDEDISFLEEFSRKNCSYFQEQIKADLGYFNHGSSLLDKTIASIRGTVAIDQTQRDRINEENQQKRDRNLQVSILAIGSGIGVGGIISSSYALMNDDKKPPYDPFDICTKLENTTIKLIHHQLPDRFSLSIIYSLGSAIAIYLLILSADKIYQNCCDRKINKSRNEN